MEAQLKKEYSKKWFDMILKNKDKISNFGKVGYNLLLTDEMVLNNLNENWDWYVLMNFNKNITIKKDLPKNDELIYYETKFYLLNSIFYFSYALGLDEYAKIKLNKIIHQTDLDACTFEKFKICYWVILSLNENLTLKLLKDNLEKPWCWNAICYNNLTYDCKKYINKCIKNVLLTKILKCKKH